MPAEFERKESSGGLTFKIYRGEGVALLDHFHFRVNASEPGALETLRLRKPPAPGEKTWFSQYYRTGHVKERDRKLFIR